MNILVRPFSRQLIDPSAGPRIIIISVIIINLLQSLTRRIQLQLYCNRISRRENPVVIHTWIPKLLATFLRSRLGIISYLARVWWKRSRWIQVQHMLVRITWEKNSSTCGCFDCSSTVWPVLSALLSPESFAFLSPESFTLLSPAPFTFLGPASFTFLSSVSPIRTVFLSIFVFQWYAIFRFFRETFCLRI